MKAWFWPALFGAMVMATVANSDAANEARPFVRGSWQVLRAAHAGQPTVVHFWGVTCGPCRTEMPQWGKLLSERPDLGLVVINADLVPNQPSAAPAMLAQ